MHPNNKYQGSYDFKALVTLLPELEEHIVINPRGQQTIKFSNPVSVKLLNKSLLMRYYGISYWDLPDGYLVPPIGTGANLIYPIVAISAYGWTVVGSDIDQIALSNGQDIIDQNESLQGNCILRNQANRQHILTGIIQSDDYFDLVICNPPFHTSAAQASKVAARKRKNLKYKKGNQKLNFGGTSNELWCPGGEASFIKTMIHESKDLSGQCGWCTTLVSSYRLLESLEQLLLKLNAKEIRIIDMQHGNKTTQILCWRF